MLFYLPFYLKLLSNLYKNSYTSCCKCCYLKANVASSCGVLLEHKCCSIKCKNIINSYQLWKMGKKN